MAIKYTKKVSRKVLFILIGPAFTPPPPPSLNGLAISGGTFFCGFPYYLHILTMTWAGNFFWASLFVYCGC